MKLAIFSRLTKPDAPRAWIFLGQDPARLAACSRLLGEDRQVDVTAKLREVAMGLRRPFLDMIPKLGAVQTDAPGWWASSLAWKNVGVSDFFLLCCYRHLIDALAKEPAGAGGPLVIVEDPWLFCQCGGSAGLWPGKLLFLFRGAAARVRWVLRAAAERAAQSWHSGLRPRLPERVDCLLHSWLYEGCLSGERDWKDHIFGDLDARLRRRGLTVGRLVPIGARKAASALARRSAYVYPMILFASATDIIAGALAYWRLRLPPRTLLEGLDVSLLAERDWWADVSFARWCESRLFYRCAARLFREHPPRSLALPYENQPWEKLLVFAAREAGVRCVGYQHTITPLFELNNFLGAGESDAAPQPDFILTTGDIPRAALTAHGLPERRTLVGGSLRFPHLADGNTEPSLRRGGSDGFKQVLVLIGHQRKVSESLLRELRSSFPDRGENDKLRFFFRPHPTFLNVAPRLYDWMPLAGGELADLLSGFDAALGTGTTAILEARLAGLPTVLYRPPNLIDSMDLERLLPEQSVLWASRTTLADQVRKAASLGRQNVDRDLLSFKSGCFAPFAEETWLQCMSGARR